MADQLDNYAIIIRFIDVWVNIVVGSKQGFPGSLCS